MSKTVYIKINSAGYCQPAHPLYCRHGCAAKTYRVDGVPTDVSPTTVALRMSPLTLWPTAGLSLNDDAAWVVAWDKIASAQPGAIIRTGIPATKRICKYTLGLKVKGHSIKRPTLVKAFFEGEEGSDITITIESGKTLGRFLKLGDVKISWEEFCNRPCDPCDKIAEARWAFEKFGLTICGSGDV